MEKIWEDDNEPLDYLDLGVPYFQVQTHSCCQIRELVGCWSPWTRWKKAGIGQLFDAHAKCHWNWNKYIYWYKKRHQPNQIPSGNQTWFAEKSTICSWFSHSNFHFDRGCPIIATFDVNDASPGQEPLKSRRISSPRQTSLWQSLLQQPPWKFVKAQGESLSILRVGLLFRLGTHQQTHPRDFDIFCAYIADSGLHLHATSEKRASGRHREIQISGRWGGEAALEVTKIDNLTTIDKPTKNILKYTQIILDLRIHPMIRILCRFFYEQCLKSPGDATNPVSEPHPEPTKSVWEWQSVNWALLIWYSQQ